MKNQQNNQTPFFVNHTSYTEETSEAYDNDTRPDTYTSHEIISIETGSEKHFNCTGNFQYEEGTPVYLVSLIYSDGDSFGYDVNRNIEFIEVFKTEEKANICKEIIENHYKLSKINMNYINNENDISNEILEFAQTYYKNNNITKNDIFKEKIKNHDNYKVTYSDEAGESKKIYAGWVGYFERLSSVEIKQLTPNQKTKKYRI